MTKDDLWPVVCRMSGPFTATELARAAGVTRQTVLKPLQQLVTVGRVRDTGERRKHGGPGRPAPVFERPFASVSRATLRAMNAQPNPQVNRPKRPPPEQELRRYTPKESRGVPVAGSRRARITNPDVRKLIEDVEKTGLTVERGSKHYIARTEKGNVPIPVSPSDHRALLNTRSELRRRGVPV